MYTPTLRPKLDVSNSTWLSFFSASFLSPFLRLLHIFWPHLSSVIHSSVIFAFISPSSLPPIFLLIILYLFTFSLLPTIIHFNVIFMFISLLLTPRIISFIITLSSLFPLQFFALITSCHHPLHYHHHHFHTQLLASFPFIIIIILSPNTVVSILTGDRAM